MVFVSVGLRLILLGSKDGKKFVNIMLIISY